jgi:hypothetical protein
MHQNLVNYVCICASFRFIASSSRSWLIGQTHLSFRIYKKKHLTTWVSQKNVIQGIPSRRILKQTYRCVTSKNVSPTYRIKTKYLFKPNVFLNPQKRRAMQEKTALKAGSAARLTRTRRRRTYQRPSVGCLDSDNAKRIERVEKGDIFVF